jgi:branched-chain amino acid transport system substrate-binding protein
MKGDNLMDRQIKIGCVLPLSGPESRHARAQLLAVKLAFEEIEPQLDLPFGVELVIGDDEFDSEVAADIARAWASDENMLGVVGPMNSKTSLTVAPIFSEAGLVHIATAASNPTLTRRGWETFFRVVVNDVHHYRAAARFAVEGLKASRISVVYAAGGTFSGPMAEGFRDVALDLGAEIPAFMDVPGGQEDYRETADHLARSESDLIFFVLGEDTAPILANQLREAGVAAPFFATDGLKPFPYFATPDYDVEGPYYTNVCADPRVKREAGEMVSRYVERYGEEPTVYMAEAYDAAAILLSALKMTASNHPDRQEVLEAVAATRDFEGTSGKITFDQHGDILDPEIGIYKVESRELRFLGYTKDVLQDERVLAS